MSRNHQIRNISEKVLPEVTMMKNGKIMRDGAGKPVLVNHFKTIKNIEKKHGKEAVGRYINGIFAQEEARLRKEWWNKWLSIGFVVLFITAFIVFLCLK